MDFWKIIHSIQKGQTKQSLLARATKNLGKLSGPQILAFFYHYLEIHEQLKTRDLYGASIIINGGECDCECFEYFRNFLIVNGDHLCVLGVTFPDQLGLEKSVKEHACGTAQERDLKGAVFAAYYNVTGRNIFDDAADYSSERFIRNLDCQALGTFDFKELQSRYPILFAAFPFSADHAANNRRFDNPYDVTEVLVPKLGAIKIGDHLRHRQFGIGLIKRVILFPGQAARAIVLFKDWPRELSFDDPECFDSL